MNHISVWCGMNILHPKVAQFDEGGVTTVIDGKLLIQGGTKLNELPTSVQVVHSSNQINNN